ncbi:MAG: DUF2851 family protein, partial [Salinivirgaceae bacterium]|nr:DUF2851 family protein [Salinivirgaceae bacterium]
MKEDFLHYLWKQRLFKNKPIVTTNNEVVELLACGEHNFDSGPDFFNAKIKIGNTIWAGNVEIHVNASDWKKHKHSSNSAYDNVILHVVANADCIVKRKNGEELPTVILEWSQILQNQYLYLMNSTDWIPCESFINKIDAFTFFQWKEALLVERLNEKAEVIKERFINTNNNWEEAFYQTLAYNFGFNKNSFA